MGKTCSSFCIFSLSLFLIVSCSKTTKGISSGSPLGTTTSVDCFFTDPVQGFIGNGNNKILVGYQSGNPANISINYSCEKDGQPVLFSTVALDGSDVSSTGVLRLPANLTNGKHTLNVSGIDPQTNNASPIFTYTFNIDLSTPFVIANSISVTANTGHSATVKFNAVDTNVSGVLTSGIGSVKVAIVSEIPANLGSLTFSTPCASVTTAANTGIATCTHTFSQLNENSDYYVFFKVYDNVQNENSLNTDTTDDDDVGASFVKFHSPFAGSAPGLCHINTLSLPPTIITQNTFTINYTCDDSTHDNYCALKGPGLNGAYNDCTNLTSFTTPTLTTEGTYDFCVRDAMNTQEICLSSPSISQSIFFDNSLPIISATTPATNPALQDVSVSFSASDTGAGIDSITCAVQDTVTGTIYDANHGTDASKGLEDYLDKSKSTLRCATLGADDLHNISTSKIFSSLQYLNKNKIYFRVYDRAGKSADTSIEVTPVPSTDLTCAMTDTPDNTWINADTLSTKQMSATCNMAVPHQATQQLAQQLVQELTSDVKLVCSVKNLSTNAIYPSAGTDNSCNITNAAPTCNTATPTICTWDGSINIGALPSGFVNSGDTLQYSLVANYYTNDTPAQLIKTVTKTDTISYDSEPPSINTPTFDVLPVLASSYLSIDYPSVTNADPTPGSGMSTNNPVIATVYSCLANATTTACDTANLVKVTDSTVANGNLIAKTNGFTLLFDSSLFTVNRRYVVKLQLTDAAGNQTTFPTLRKTTTAATTDLDRKSFSIPVAYAAPALPTVTPITGVIPTAYDSITITATTNVNLQPAQTITDGLTTANPYLIDVAPTVATTNVKEFPVKIHSSNPAYNSYNTDRLNILKCKLTGTLLSGQSTEFNTTGTPSVYCAGSANRAGSIVANNIDYTFTIPYEKYNTGSVSLEVTSCDSAYETKCSAVTTFTRYIARKQDGIPSVQTTLTAKPASLLFFKYVLASTTLGSTLITTTDDVYSYFLAGDNITQYAYVQCAPYTDSNQTTSGVADIFGGVRCNFSGDASWKPAIINFTQPPGNNGVLPPNGGAIKVLAAVKALNTCASNASMKYKYSSDIGINRCIEDCAKQVGNGSETVPPDATHINGSCVCSAGFVTNTVDSNGNLKSCKPQ